MKDKKKQAQDRAEVILQVRSGLITAKEGARRLGISRKTYYQWDKRALEGMLAHLEEQPPGRPQKLSDPKVEALEAKVKLLEAKLEIACQTAEVRGLLNEMQRTKDKAAARAAKAAATKKKQKKSPNSSP